MRLASRVIAHLGLFLGLMWGAPQAEQGGPDTIAGGVQNPQAVTRGQAEFAKACAFCHGEDARGRSGPDLVRSTVVLRDVKGDLIGELLRTGRPAKGMPAFAMSGSQVSDVAAFLHSRTHMAADRFRYVIDGLITGNPEKGKAFFNGEGKCAGCHSTSGDLAHIASKYDPVELQSRFLAPPPAEYPQSFAAGKIPALAASVTVTLPSGERVSGTLARKDAFDIALITPEGWYRSFPRSRVTIDIHDPLQAHRDLLPTYTDEMMHDMLAYLESLK